MADARMTRSRQLLFALLSAGLCLAGTSVAAAAPPSAAVMAAPLRVVLLVDSSSAVSTILTQMRAGLSAFVEGLPEDVEVAMISTGGQLRVRVPPGTDRDKLRKAAAGFASDGGGNTFLDTMLESDQRFLKKAPECRPVFVIVTTDAESRSAPRIDEYNKFVNDFRQRGGRAHAVVIKGSNLGTASQILGNLTSNTTGIYEVMAIANGLADKMKGIAARVAADSKASN